MNKTAATTAFLLAVGTTIAGGFAAISSLLAPKGVFVAYCKAGADCVLIMSPQPDQCEVLLEGGGDRPGEVSGLDGDNAEAARMLFAMQEAGLITGFRTLISDTGCEIAVALSAAQAESWRLALMSQADGGQVLEEAVAVLGPGVMADVPVQWGGWSLPEERTEKLVLSALSDAGVESTGEGEGEGEGE